MKGFINSNSPRVMFCAMILGTIFICEPAWSESTSGNTQKTDSSSANVLSEADAGRSAGFGGGGRKAYNPQPWFQSPACLQTSFSRLPGFQTTSSQDTLTPDRQVPRLQAIVRLRDRPSPQGTPAVRSNTPQLEFTWVSPGRPGASPGVTPGRNAYNTTGDSGFVAGTPGRSPGAKPPVSIASPVRQPPTGIVNRTKTTGIARINRQKPSNFNLTPGVSGQGRRPPTNISSISRPPGSTTPPGSLNRRSPGGKTPEFTRNWFCARRWKNSWGTNLLDRLAQVLFQYLAEPQGGGDTRRIRSRITPRCRTDSRSLAAVGPGRRPPGTVAVGPGRRPPGGFGPGFIPIGGRGPGGMGLGPGGRDPELSLSVLVDPAESPREDLDPASFL